MSSSAIEGHTRWKRFAGVLVVSLLIAGGLLFGLAHGAIGASFAESGSNFKTSASQLRGSGFAQYSAVDRTASGAHPVARTTIGTASLDNFCQSAFVPALPLVGDVSLVIRAVGRDSVQASNLVTNISALTGTLSFQNIDTGLDASQVTVGTPGLPGAFAQQADRIVVNDLRQTARRITASTLILNGANFTVTTGRSECF